MAVGARVRACDSGSSCGGFGGDLAAERVRHGSGDSGETWDWLDPRTLPAVADTDTLWLSLSDRIDVGCWLDRQDHEWARSLGSGFWCHTYGSGEIDPETGVIARPAGIYARKTIAGRTLFLHREVARRAYGPPTLLNMVVDHQNGDTLDNRRVNLRWVTRSYNAINIAGSTLRERLIREVETRL